MKENNKGKEREGKGRCGGVCEDLLAHCPATTHSSCLRSIGWVVSRTRAETTTQKPSLSFRLLFPSRQAGSIDRSASEKFRSTDLGVNCLSERAGVVTCMPMMNVLSGHRHYVLQPHRAHHHHHRHPRRTVTNSPGQLAVTCDPRSRMGRSSSSFRHRGAAVRAVIDGGGKGESSSGKDDDDDDNGEEAEEEEESSSKKNRADLERLVGSAADASFSGLDLATLIRERYGRSYDVTLIRKEFMGRNLLAMNVMWKYREQRSFPLTEEEYLLRLDDVANTLRCWGAVAHVRNTLQKVRERPRIGKAVSIFIDMDTTGGARSDEWIYK